MTRRLLIITSFVHPPIPRNMDWSAVTDNYDGPGSPIGYGPSEGDAVADLYHQITEREDDDEERARHEHPDPDYLRDKKRDDALWDQQNSLPPTDDEPF